MTIVRCSCGYPQKGKETYSILITASAQANERLLRAFPAAERAHLAAQLDLLTDFANEMLREERGRLAGVKVVHRSSWFVQ